jgi:hypothetical protein
MTTNPWRRALRRTGRGGVVLDVILAFGIILVGAFLLFEMGLTFHQVIRGAERFFGV